MLFIVKKTCPIARWMTAIIGAIYSHSASANPEGVTIRAGQATFHVNGSVLSITTSQKAFLDWRTFNVGAGETTQFIQPYAASIVWNRINDPNPSQIFGRIEANGVVVLANQYGFFFGPNSVVKAAGFVATTGVITPDMEPGGAWNFSGMPPLASIVNYGKVEVNSGGSLFLIAEKIENHGVLTTPDGTLGLYAGKEVLVSERPDGRGLAAKVILPSGSVDNHGKLIADGGTVALHAQVVNQGGLIQANSAREVDGGIELVAADTVNLEASSRISAAGGTAGNGGNIRIQAGLSIVDQPGSQISVAGGTLAGHGGALELSAPQIPQINSQLDGHAAPGQTGGELLIDPDFIRISGNTAPKASDAPGTLVVTPSQYDGFSHISLQANRDIVNETPWTLADSADATSLLRLQAGRDIQFMTGSAIRAGENWSVELVAGANLATVNSVLPDAGSIVLSGQTLISTKNGFIHLYAGKDVLITGAGALSPVDQYVHTTAGGSIDVLALSGSINTGISRSGYSFSGDFDNPYTPLENLGGISTAAGGNVRLVAGKDVTSYLPLVLSASQGTESDGGSGAFGPQPGDVTVMAGGKVTGHYVVANGVGTITAGTTAGNASTALALSLIKGSWNVSANDIYLQQVRNPNAVFNNSTANQLANFHRFDYDPAAAVTLNAVNSVTLSGSNIPLDANRFKTGIVYPPSLEINAGAGGISVLNNLSLFPSPLGQLELNTTGGGSLKGLQSAGGIATIIVSDSAKTRFTVPSDFGVDDRGGTLLHLNDPDPVRLNISGNVEKVFVSSPKRAEINIAGDVINSGFAAQNLHVDDVSFLTVGGSIINRNKYTFYDNADAGPNLDVFDFAVPPFSSNPFSYNPDTKRIALFGKMSLTDLNAFLNTKVQKLDQSLQPEFDEFGQPVLVAAQFLDPVILQYLFDHSQDIPSGSNVGTTGYQIYGPGEFRVTAQNISLGVTEGIVSHGAQKNRALASIGDGRGAALTINLSGNLEMYSSSVGSLAGGKIDIHAGGDLQLGSPEVKIDSSVPRGIYTSTKADINVVANGDIEIQGSRIAAYDGGNITVKSLTGNVDAGSGGLGSQKVFRITVDPLTGEVKSLGVNIPGSGILATSFPQNSQEGVGNITVETPFGDILGGTGGFVQLSLNGQPSLGSKVSLKAGGGILPDNSAAIGNISIAGSGVIGINVGLDATGDISGNAIARQNIDIKALQNVSVTALGGGAVSVAAVGTVSGTVIGMGSVSATGASVEANLLSANVQGGSATSGQTGFANTAVASATSQSASAQAEPAKAAAKAAATEAMTDPTEEKKKKAATALVRTTGRVTVIIPGK